MKKIEKARKKKKIFLIGNFGKKESDLNGQTMRTRTVYNSMLLNNCYKVNRFDTSTYMRSNFFVKLMMFISIVPFLLFSNKIILLPGQNSITALLRICYYLNYTFKKKFILITIGGWLPDYLRVNKSNYRYLIKASSILVQTLSMRNQLLEIGLKNTVHFPNYRIYDEFDNPVTKIKYNLNSVVMYSRVTQSKGILDGISAVKNFNRVYEDRPLKLDIYGPIDSEFMFIFQNHIDKDDNINYRGVIYPNNVRKTLSNYDLLLFPTYYHGEGHPGTLIDSFFSHLPSVTTKWKYNEELVFHDYNGYIVNIKSPKEILDCLIKLKKNPDILEFFSRNCIKESKKYEFENIFRVLRDKL